MSTPSRRQIESTRNIVEWYFETHHGRPGDVGMVGTFCEPRAVGHFAVDRAAIERGDSAALFRLFVTVTMFQRLRDALVMNILRSISGKDAAELTSVDALLALCSTSACRLSTSNNKLIQTCDLTKDEKKRGSCSVAPETQCHLKRHTELLRRYGHFGKVPTSAALVVSESGGDMEALRARVFSSETDPLARAQGLQESLSKVWRVSEKISSMYLSLVTAPCMGLENAPWGSGLDWTWFVVVDRNVDLFLEAIGYSGTGTYAARREFILKLAERIDLRTMDKSLPTFHPRLVQQAMFLFMSASNRRVATDDCSREGAKACGSCPRIRRERCPLAS